MCKIRFNFAKGENLINPLNSPSLCEKQGILYRIDFGSGHFYYGISKRTFKRRYATKALGKGCPQVVEAAKTGWSATILSSGHSWKELGEIEGLIVDREMTANPMCLNKNEGGSYSQLRWDGGHKKAILLVDPSGKQHMFKTQTEAAEKVGCSIPQISNVKSGRRNSVHGWHLPSVVPKRPKNKKKIILVKDGKRKTFESVLQASEYIGCHRTSLSRMINKNFKRGKQESVYGWKFHSKLY